MAKFKDRYGDDIEITRDEDDVYIELTQRSFGIGETIALAVRPKKARKIARALLRLAEEVEAGL